ncbi:Cytochrome P450 3A17 [Trichoplax sp. H2]|uniref:Cytochrome P450 n=1 Tax=Trichoplax adhaerens TaxID=10228 RepID=B3RU53_TRIAD|nr:hypothetical protein TRIADDRAFT_55159 [Trichoplax adhaerens]EDV25281.1 hypothetical protein TRIADDRAFT_55159 [Trichoplax adhaerens]RDD37350.1 Cytochrome P450 3A17 [Trichoplax sp. H2]|eukprot:XP_002111314.1 hypothetical protein TRIADDRAFT_55159 [Trichoplax adhaerens]
MDASNGYLPNPTMMVIAVTVLLLGLAYIYFVAPLAFFKRLGIPGPKPTLMFGNLLQVGSGEHLLHLQWSQQYGKIFGLLFGRLPVIFVADPDMIKAITVKYSQNFIDRWSICKPSPPLGLGLFSLNGQAWRRLHNMLLSVFNDAELKLTMPYITKSSSTLVRKLHQSINHGKVIDLWQYLSPFSMEVILATSFGIKVSSQENPDQMTHQARQLYRNYNFRNLMLAILPPTLCNWLDQLFSWNRISYLEQVLRKAVKERRQMLKEEHSKTYPDLLQAMLKIQDGDSLTDDEVIGQSIQFLLTGCETTASALAFTLYLLAMNPDIQRELRSEIMQRYSINDIMTLDGVAKLKYLDRVISESLRMYPPTYFYVHQANAETMINGYVFPKGVGVAIPVYTVHHDPEFWPEPDNFKPERFETNLNSKQHSHSYLPFGSGPRSCLGAKFALLQIKMALIKLLLTFRFYKIDQTEIPLQVKCGLVLSPKNGIYLGIHKL